MRTRATLGFLLLFLAGMMIPAVGQAAKKVQKQKAAAGARPTLTIGKGQTLLFSQYKAVNGLVYNADGKIQIADINKAWAAISDLDISGTLEIKRTDPNVRVNDIMIVNKLTIEDGGRIETDGNFLTIFANDFETVVNPKIAASILSFDPANRKAASAPAQNGRGGDGNVPGAGGSPGPNGVQGTLGEMGGGIHIFTSKFTGPLTIDLSGQDGGDGSKGGRGGDGAQGPHGGDAETDPSGIFCRHDGDNGAPGGPSGPGGQGGQAGRGGDGGVLSFFFVTSDTVTATNPRITVDAGKPGAKGHGGDPGTPGRGGIAGSGRDGCHGGIQGPDGGSGGSYGDGPDAASAAKGSSNVIQLAGAAKIESSFKEAVSHQAVPKVPLLEQFGNQIK